MFQSFKERLSGFIERLKRNSYKNQLNYVQHLFDDYEKWPEHNIKGGLGVIEGLTPLNIYDELRIKFSTRRVSLAKTFSLINDLKGRQRILFYGHTTENVPIYRALRWDC